MMRARLILSAALGAVLVPAGATAQTYSVNSISPVTAYGEVAAAITGDTIFYQNNTTVTVESGGGAWIKGTKRRATVTIRCVNGVPANAATNCGTITNNARVMVGNVSSTGRAKPFSQFIAIAGSGTITGTTTGVPLDFVLSGFTGTGNKTFLLDTKMPVAGDNEGGTTGALTNTYYVYVAKDPASPVAGLTTAATITVRRALYMVKDFDLRFGSLVKLASGSGTVIVDSTVDSTRTTGGTNPPLLVTTGGPGYSSAYGRAKYTIYGEPGTNFSIAYSPTGNVVMTNQTTGSGTLSVTMVKTNSGTTAMPAAGYLVLGVGGTITVNSGTVTRGHYQGSFTVTITYN